MSTILPFLQRAEAASGQADIRAMSMALDDVCAALKLGGDSVARSTITTRIIELARRGERSPTKTQRDIIANPFARSPI